MVSDIHIALHIASHSLDRVDSDVECVRVYRDCVRIYDFVVLCTFVFRSVVAQTDKQVTGGRTDVGCLQSHGRTQNDTRVHNERRIVVGCSSCAGFERGRTVEDNRTGLQGREVDVRCSAFKLIEV